MKKHRKAAKNRQSLGTQNDPQNGNSNSEHPNLPEEIVTAYEDLQSLPPDTCCDVSGREVEAILERNCMDKAQTVPGQQSPCGTEDGPAPLVDLVVVIDSSPSMADEAVALSAAAAAAIAAAQTNCAPNLRDVVYLGIQGIFDEPTPPLNTLFNQTVRNYLIGQGVDPGDLTADITTAPSGFPDREQGANSVADLADHFDWRPGASRNIFFLGDEAMLGGNPQNSDDVDATTEAIRVCDAQGVKVFTYAGTPPSGGASVAHLSDYRRLAEDTEGTFFSAAGGIANFASILEEIICSSTEQYSCAPAPIVHHQPCFEFHYGGSPGDLITDHELELVCVTACNPYSNLTFKDVTINVAVILDSDGNAVPNTVNGFPKVLIKPSYQICFGDLKPCDPDTPNQRSCVSREFVLGTTNAPAGSYSLHISYCYKVEYCCQGQDVFVFDVVEEVETTPEPTDPTPS